MTEKDGTTLKVRIIQSCAGPSGVFRVGETTTLPKRAAHRLIAAGYAETAPADIEETVKAEIATAMEAVQPAAMSAEDFRAIIREEIAAALKESPPPAEGNVISGEVNDLAGADSGEEIIIPPTKGKKPKEKGSAEHADNDRSGAASLGPAGENDGN